MPAPSRMKSASLVIRARERFGPRTSITSIVAFSTNCWTLLYSPRSFGTRNDLDPRLPPLLGEVTWQDRERQPGFHQRIGPDVDLQDVVRQSADDLALGHVVLERIALLHQLRGRFRPPAAGDRSTWPSSLVFARTAASLSPFDLREHLAGLFLLLD